MLAEALRNVRKHAGPSMVRVNVQEADGTFVLEVVNDGAASCRPGSRGWGLRLAAFEALQAGGFVEFGPRGEDSWQVRLVVPHER